MSEFSRVCDERAISLPQRLSLLEMFLFLKFTAKMLLSVFNILLSWQY